MPVEVAGAVPDTGLALLDGTRLTLEALPYTLDDESA
jgi:hypothetical protein